MRRFWPYVRLCSCVGGGGGVGGGAVQMSQFTRDCTAVLLTEHGWKGFSDAQISALPAAGPHQFCPLHCIAQKLF